MMNKLQVLDKIKRHEEAIELLKEVLQTDPEKGKMGRPQGETKYTSEQLNFIKNNRDITMIKLVQKFNDKFGTNLRKNSRTLYNLMDRQGI